MAEGKGVALAILGIVALIAVVGLILLFSGRMTGQVVQRGIYDADKTYGGWDRVQQTTPRGEPGLPYAGGYVKGVPVTPEGQVVSVIGGKQSVERIPSLQTTCPAGLIRVGSRGLLRLSDEEYVQCVPFPYGDPGDMCCPAPSLG